MASKGAFKRNLFGEKTGDQSPVTLAKKIVDSPLKVKSIGNGKNSVGGKDKKGKGVLIFCLIVVLNQTELID